MKKIVLLAATVVVGIVASQALGAKGMPPITVGPVAITGAEDIGTCNNVWAYDSYNKFYKLTLNVDGTYNLKVDYRQGTFVTANANPYGGRADASPGACESGSDNGNSVAPGLTGRMHETWNNSGLTATAAPNPNPDCGANNAACPTAASFLDAVFGPGQYTLGAWTYTGHYEAGSHGVWFDTMTNWPLNDRGDITSP